MILDMDLGNTRAKWRLSDEQVILEQGAADISFWLEGIYPKAWSEGHINRIRIASVLAPTKEVDLIAKLQSRFITYPELAKSEASCRGVFNAYGIPVQLGVDRWLGIIAAYQKYRRACVVIDVGTALKVDAIDGAGKHIGGYIIPGARLMERALLHGTDRVRYTSEDIIENISLGRDTRACVQGGIAAALVGAVLIGVKQFCKRLDGSPCLVITGGLGHRIKKCLEEVEEVNAVLEADLVLDGLRWALP